MIEDDNTESRQKGRPLPFKFGEGANRIAKCLIESGPMTEKELKRALLATGNFRKPMAINRTLKVDLAGSVVFRDGKWEFIGDIRFAP